MLKRMIMMEKVETSRPSIFQEDTLSLTRVRARG